MSFPLASIAVYSSVVFGVFSNTQRLLSQLRHGDPSRTPELADMALASTVAGFVSAAIGTPVDLVKIRLQMQTQPYIEGRKQEFLPHFSPSSWCLLRALGQLRFKAWLSAASGHCNWAKKASFCLGMDPILLSSRGGFSSMTLMRTPPSFPADWVP